MDRESAVASGGSYISLNENEKRYYSGLHNMCQDDSSGKLSSSKVTELFKTSQLPPESLHQCGVRKFGVGFVSLPSGMVGGHSIGVIDMQALEHCYALIQDACRITEVCGAKRLGYFGTLQLYVALKLLAAAQSGLPIRLESITSNLPLPMFVGLSVEPELHYSTFSQGMETQGLQCGSALVPVPWTPVDRSAFRHQDGSVEKKEPWSPDRSPCCSPPRSPSAFHNYPYAMQKNGTDSQMGSSCDMLRHIEPRSAVFSAEAVCSPPHPETIQSKYSARAVVQLEKHTSPSIYRPKAGLEHPAVPQAPSVERQDQRGVADYSEDDPWRITVEQREYYTVQFTTLQPDLGALILGAVAKNFFTKSKLPIPELSHIWELSDVDQDGALTFSEFCTAFHLIVARKNGYTLPEALPATLQPGFTEQEDIPDTPDSVEPLIVFEDAEPKLSHLERTIVERLKPVLATPKQEMKEESCKQDFSSKSGQDKYTQQVGPLPCRPEPPHDLDPQMKTKTRPRSYSSASIDDAMKKREDPPTPPPRPQKTHSRASSLDLNKLFQQGALGIKGGRLPPPPALPPRPSVTQVPHFISSAENTPQKTVRQPNFADFSRFREEEETVVNTKEQSPLRRGVPSTEDLTKTVKQDITRVSQHHAPQKPVRRKYQPDSQNLDSSPTHATSLTPAHKPAQKLLSRQRKEIQMAIRKNKETNAVLTRLNSELQQQLKEVHQERVTLESQLELLRPLASA